MRGFAGSPLGRFVAALVSCVASAAAAETPVVMDKEREAKLSAGEIFVEGEPVVGSDEPEVILTGVIDAPPSVVWDLLEDCDSYKRTMPRIVQSRELVRTATTRTCRTVLDAPWPLSDLVAVAESTIDLTPGRWSRRWTLVRGDFVKYSGSWTLVPFGPDGTRTLAIQRSHTIMKTEVPGFIRDIAVKSGMPDVIRSLRTHAANRKSVETPPEKGLARGAGGTEPAPQ